MMDYLKYRYRDDAAAPVRDAQGRLIPREEFYISGINCTPSSFPLEVKALCERYGQCRTAREVNLVHWIVGYDGRDREEGRLDGEMAQELTEELIHRCLPNYASVICTHTDGYNHYGNIHSHVLTCVICMKEDPVRMEHYEPVRPGNKLHIPFVQMREMKKILSEICRREGLRWKDPNRYAEKKITPREHWARWRGQKKLDEKNEALYAAGLLPKETVFQTEKEKVRTAIADTLELAQTEEEFRQILKERYGIGIWEKDGFWRYRREETGESFSGYSLGTLYTETHIREDLFLRSAGMRPLTIGERTARPVATMESPWPQYDDEVPGFLRKHGIDTKEQLQELLFRMRERRREIAVSKLNSDRELDRMSVHIWRKRNEMEDRLQTDPEYCWEEKHLTMLGLLRERMEIRQEAALLRQERESLNKAFPILEKVSFDRAEQRMETVAEQERDRSRLAAEWER